MVSPVEQALIETISSDSFLDLRLHLPNSIMQYEQDVKMIVEEMALHSVVDATSEDQGGSTIISGGEALFVSQGMIRHITKIVLPPLVESFAKTHAEEMNSRSAINETREEEPDLVSSSKTKRGRKSSKKAKTGMSQTKEGTQSGVVPLVVVAKAVAVEYPDLADMQSRFGPIFDDGDPCGPVWEQGGFLAHSDDVGGGLLYELCRSVVYNHEFQSSCELAVQAERERLNSIKMSRSVRSRKDGAAKMRSVESAFEDPGCYDAACYAIQEHAKFLQYVGTLSDADEKMTNALKEDFLCGCCADFTGRVTKYCLFRNEVDDGLFCIESRKEMTSGKNSESSLPEYCQPLDSAARHYPSTKLICFGDSDGEPNLPLPTLREVLPGNVGIQLARTWTLCGGKCYEGGSRVGENGTETIRQGDADGFLRHVEDNCL